MEEKKIRIHIYEEILCIVSDLNLPLQLKGSYAYAHYFDCPEERLLLAEDLDFVYIGKLCDDYEEDICERLIKQILYELLERKIELDNTYYEKPEDCYIYHVDYEMEDDFITMGIEFGNVNNLELNIEITFNLFQCTKPVSLEYKALTREPFNLKYITLPEVQVGWKLHQCLVRTRVKDLVDISYLLENLNFNNSLILQNMIYSILVECVDWVNSKENDIVFNDYLVNNLKRLLNGKVQALSHNWIQLQDTYDLTIFKNFILDNILLFKTNKSLYSQVNIFWKYFVNSIFKNLDIKKCIDLIEQTVTHNYKFLEVFNCVYYDEI